MNNNQLEKESIVTSTSINKIERMDSGLRSDAWHWMNNDLSQFSSEKLNNILNLNPKAVNKGDREALDQVRKELERRAKRLTQ